MMARRPMGSNGGSEDESHRAVQSQVGCGVVGEARGTVADGGDPESEQDHKPNQRSPESAGSK